VEEAESRVVQLPRRCHHTVTLEGAGFCASPLIVWGIQIASPATSRQPLASMSDTDAAARAPAWRHGPLPDVETFRGSVDVRSNVHQRSRTPEGPQIERLGRHGHGDCRQEEDKEEDRFEGEEGEGRGEDPLPLPPAVSSRSHFCPIDGSLFSFSCRKKESEASFDRFSSSAPQSSAAVPFGETVLPHGSIERRRTDERQQNTRKRSCTTAREPY